MSKQFLKKLLRLRKFLMKSGKSKINTMKAYKIIEKIERYLEAFPRTSEKNIKNFINRNYEDVVFLIPKGKSEDTWNERLNELINS